MDYKKFSDDYKEYTDWGTDEFNFKAAEPVPFHLNIPDVVSFSDYQKTDEVNSPAHYTRGSQEAIDIIEEAIQDAPSVKLGMLQAQTLKYLLRLWLKQNSKQDAEKARWYLNRLIDSL